MTSVYFKKPLSPDLEEARRSGARFSQGLGHVALSPDKSRYRDQGRVVLSGPSNVVPAGRMME